MPIKSADQLYSDFREEVQNQDPSLTDFNEGSLLDILGGVVSRGVAEVQALAIEEFKKTYVETATGPEETGGADDLETLLVDHFGEDFKRPDAVYAEGQVTFSRPTTGAGNIVIPAGTIVKTAANEAGSSQRFATQSAVTITGLSIAASVKAVDAGSAGNVLANTVVEIESSLVDSSITVNNASAFSGGDEVLDDAEYRQYAKNLLKTLRGATLEAIVAKAKTVSGVEEAFGAEFSQTVKEWDEAESEAVGDAFKITRVKLYIADANGTANNTLINNVKAAIATVRAAGVQVEVLAASAQTVNVSISVTLNGSGPNFAALSSSLQPIFDDIAEYLQTLAIGTGLSRSALKTHILGIWGASGSDDLTNITIVTPTGDVSVSASTKIVPGTVGAA